jgi:hypothetical protein
LILAAIKGAEDISQDHRAARDLILPKLGGLNAEKLAIRLKSLIPLLALKLIQKFLMLWIRRQPHGGSVFLKKIIYSMA